MINSNSTARDIATTMHRTYFDDTAAELNAYLDCTPTTDDSRSIRDNLIAALDFDIADMLHNANLADLIPDADALDDDAYIALDDRLLADDDYIPILADLILADTDLHND